MPRCYMRGSRLRGAQGEVPIEAIAPGDMLVVLRDGQEVLELVKWIGYSTIDLATHAMREDAAPVRIRAHAIASNQPERDLLVSPEHSLLIDGMCVPAKYLVNGGSIVSERDHAPFTYFHVELERHGILFAENLAAESYLDTGNRDTFDNADVPRQLHPRFVVQQKSRRWETDACAPLARVPQDVTPIWVRLAQRAEELGYPPPRIVGGRDAAIHLVADGRRLAAASASNGTYTFIVPAGVATVRLCSNICIPADLLLPTLRDTRRLGVRVELITLHANGDEVTFAADHPSLADGWHDAERAGGEIWRWTNGSATIPWKPFREASIATIRLRTAGHYPEYDEHLRLHA